MSVSEAGFLVFFSASLEGMLTLFTERNCAPDHRVISARFPAGNKKPPAAKLSGVLGIRRLTMTYIAQACRPSALWARRRCAPASCACRWQACHMGAVVVQRRASIQNKKAPAAIAVGAVLFRSLTMTYSHMGNATLPSAQVCFTSEFGMGSGGSRPLWSSGKTVDHWGTRRN